MSKKKSIPENAVPPGNINEESAVVKKETAIKAAEQSKKTIKNTDKNSPDMEVYHPHGFHQGRKLKDYIFEFFMLFIAITGAFLMENMRERYVERHKEKEYISSMIRDIREDTTNIHNLIHNYQQQIIGIDSLLRLLENPVSAIKINKLYSYIFSYLNNYNGFTSRDITIIQLKNSGALRLINDNSVSDSITMYYSKYESHKDQLNYNLLFFQDMVKMEMEFSNFRIRGGPALYDTSKINEFYNRTLIISAILKGESNWLAAYKDQGNSLLNYLQKEYKTYRVENL